MATPAKHLESPLTVLKPQGVPVTVFVPVALHQRLKDLANQDERSLSGQMRWVLKSYANFPAAFDDQ